MDFVVLMSFDRGQLCIGFIALDRCRELIGGSVVEIIEKVDIFAQVRNVNSWLMRCKTNPCFVECSLTNL